VTHYRDQNAISEVIAKVEAKPGRIVLTSKCGDEMNIRPECVSGWRTRPGLDFIHVYVIGAGLFSFTQTDGSRAITELVILLDRYAIERHRS
jgi:hypothetical protein